LATQSDLNRAMQQLMSTDLLFATVCVQQVQAGISLLQFVRLIRAQLNSKHTQRAATILIMSRLEREGILEQELQLCNAASSHAAGYLLLYLCRLGIDLSVVDSVADGADMPTNVAAAALRDTDHADKAAAKAMVLRLVAHVSDTAQHVPHWALIGGACGAADMLGGHCPGSLAQVRPPMRSHVLRAACLLSASSTHDQVSLKVICAACRLQCGACPALRQLLR
jgi:hypothetical protein